MDFQSLNRNSLCHRKTVWICNSANMLFADHNKSDIPNLWSLQTQHLYKMEPGVVCFYMRGQKCVGGVLALINDAFLITLTINTKIQLLYTNSSECFAFRTRGLISRYYLFFLWHILINLWDWHYQNIGLVPWQTHVFLAASGCLCTVQAIKTAFKSSSRSLLLEMYESSPSFPYN